MKKILILIFSILILPNLAIGASFDPDKVITDKDYEESDSMSRSFIQEFLLKKGSELARITVNSNGTRKSAADVLYESAKENRISPKLLIVTAQKEQSAITDGHLSDSQKDKLMGYGVYPGSDWSKYRGIENQIRYSARQYRRYLDRAQYYNFQQGKTTATSDGENVTPQNKSTAGLYNYTPYVGGEKGYTMVNQDDGGNFLFWKLWQGWFASNRPNGTLIKEAGKSGVYLLKNKKKYPFWNKQVFEARKYSMKEVIEISNEEMNGYNTVSPVLFPDGTLLGSSRGTVFVLENGKKRGFDSIETFNKLNYSEKNIYNSSDQELNLYPEGERITLQTKLHPNGSLIQKEGDQSVYQVVGGEKKIVSDLKIFSRNFYWKNLITVTEEEFNAYPTNHASVLFRDGTLLIDDDGRISLIENGEARYVSGPSVFRGLGFKTENIIRVPNWIASLHPKGEKLATY